MGPLSLVLQGIISAPGNVIEGLATHRSNYELTTIEAQHNNVPVTYSYQLWRVKTPTVCAKYKQNIGQYARCTVAAKDLFNEACLYFKPLRNKDYAHQKATEMYCSVANTYQPTIARVEVPGLNSELEEAKAACNAAVAQMIGNAGERQKAKTEKICARYYGLRDGKI